MTMILHFQLRYSVKSEGMKNFEPHPIEKLLPIIQGIDAKNVNLLYFRHFSKLKISNRVTNGIHLNRKLL